MGYYCPECELLLGDYDVVHNEDGSITCPYCENIIQDTPKEEEC